MSESTILFRDALQAVYGPLDWLPVGDGDIHRFHVPGDRSGSTNGWYVLFLDGVASGSFGSWKVGSTSTWCSREPADAREAEQIRERIEVARRQRAAEQERRHQAAAGQANRWWRDSRPATPAHPYLVRKGVPPYTLRQRGDDLLVPLYLDGCLVNLQRISPEGDKRFLYGGRINGVYSPLGTVSTNARLVICEGWATAATLHQSGYSVAAAMNAGNLRPAAVRLRARYPDTPFLIAGDDDRTTDGNPGRTAANAAALACGGLVTFPEWPADAPLTCSDFNDLAAWRRINAPT